ncbi:MAG: B-box zinc finger protein [Anaerolineales bacterium]|nr:B-box zinc finger protein [Anaerolineales bacterium]
MDEQTLTCAYHPGRPTSLRCNRCGQPICTQCAVRTPVGYRCRQCVREQQKIFDTSKWYDFPVAFVAAALVCGAGSILSAFIGFFILFVAAFAGSIAARAVAWAVRHRRNKYLWLAAVAGGVAGSLPIMIPTLALVLVSWGQVGAEGLFALGFQLLWPGAYMIIAVGVLAANMKGVRIL